MHRKKTISQCTIPTIKVNPKYRIFYSYYFFLWHREVISRCFFLCVMNESAADLGLIADLVLD